MDELKVTQIIKEQTHRALWSIINVISCIPDSEYERCYCDMPLWKHVYHTLHSLDQWYINPSKYIEPAFHVANLNSLDVHTDKVLSKQEVDQYLLSVTNKIEAYIGRLDENLLLEKPEGCKWTRLTLIIAQLRHLQYHTGIIMGFIICDTGKWPLVIGLENEIPGNDFPYFG